MFDDVGTDGDLPEPVKAKPTRSAAQVDASRVNGTKGKGPVTQSGKEKSSVNARKHGLLGKKIWFADPEEATSYHTCLDSLFEVYEPVGELESFYVTDIAFCITMSGKCAEWLIQLQSTTPEFSRQDQSRIKFTARVQKIRTFCDAFIAGQDAFLGAGNANWVYDMMAQMPSFDRFKARLQEHSRSDDEGHTVPQWYRKRVVDVLTGRETLLHDDRFGWREILAQVLTSTEGDSEYRPDLQSPRMVVVTALQVIRGHLKEIMQVDVYAGRWHKRIERDLKNLLSLQELRRRSTFVGTIDATQPKLTLEPEEPAEAHEADHRDHVNAEPVAANPPNPFGDD